MTTTNGNGMKVIHLEVENFKRIQAVSTTPNGETEIIGGFNEQGKTSALDALACAIGGGKLVPAVALRKGTKKGKVRVVVGETEPLRLETADLIIERNFTKNGSTLTVTGKDGLRKASPQKLLDQLFGNLSFDPLAFVGMKPADQLKTLKEIVGIDFSQLDAERERAYNERTFINREMKQLEAKVDNLPYFPEAPKQPVDTAALLAELQAAETRNKASETAEREIERLTTLIAQGDAELARLRARAMEIKGEQEGARTQMAQVAENAIEPIDTSAITDQLVNAEELNEKIAANARHKEVEAELNDKGKESLKLTATIDRIDGKKAEQLTEAKFPVNGLGFGDDGVLFNGLPFEQASEEQQIVVSAATGLALNPKLRILLIRKGALLDTKHRASLVQWGQDNNCQLFIEVVSVDDGCTLVIEDGMVAEDRKEAA